MSFYCFQPEVRLLNMNMKTQAFKIKFTSLSWNPPALLDRLHFGLCRQCCRFCTGKQNNSPWNDCITLHPRWVSLQKKFWEKIQKSYSIRKCKKNTQNNTPWKDCITLHPRWLSLQKKFWEKIQKLYSERKCKN